MLVDLSSNGTYVTQRDGKGKLIKQGMQTLDHPCVITFGVPYDRLASDQVRFETGVFAE